MSEDVYDDVYDFEGYYNWLTERTNKDFFEKLSVFGQAFLALFGTLKSGSDAFILNTEQTFDLSSVIHQRIDDLASCYSTIVIARYVLTTSRNMKTSIESTLENDFPKFLGTRSNFWRYLIHFVTKYTNAVDPDFTTQFLVSNACFIELIHYCFKLKQYYITKHDKIFWMAMVLRFFGERFEEGNEKMSYLKLSRVQIVDKTTTVHKRRKNKN